MAKYGEGDPRWIVQERADGANVNSWHWVEKDCTEWSKQRLNEIFSSLALVDDNSWKITTSGVDSFSGEAILNNRKKKLIPSYELDVKVKWQAAKAGEESGAVRGLIHFPYIADENFDEEPEIRVTTEDDSAAGQQAKQHMLAQGKQVLLKSINSFLLELKAGGPAKHDSDTTTPSDKPKLTSAPVEAVRKPAVSKPPVKSTTKLSLTERFYARPRDIYEAFTNESKVKAFTQSDAKVEPKVGGAFSWFGGSVVGTFKELTEYSKIEMEWRFSTWEDNYFSKVVIEFQEPDPGNTVVTLTHTKIPEQDKFGNEDVLDVVERGWRMNIFQRIRGVFGYGV